LRSGEESNLSTGSYPSSTTFHRNRTDLVSNLTILKQHIHQVGISMFWTFNLLLSYSTKHNTSWGV